MYLQLPSISGGRSSIRNLTTRHAVVAGTHLSWMIVYMTSKTFFKKKLLYVLNV
jgi:hypothetical protein